VLIALLILAALVVIGVLSAIAIRNGIIRERNRCDQAWSDVDVQLKRRHDLVPNLVESVKGYASHERNVFEEVTTARAAAMRAEGPAESARAEEGLTAALLNLRAVAERYPQLRATENFQQLNANLSDLEGQIQAARRTYNADVRAYNTKIQVFPNSTIAKRSGFLPREYFAVDEAAERRAPAVTFGA
jgi:LemA protein